MKLLKWLKGVFSGEGRNVSFDLSDFSEEIDYSCDYPNVLFDREEMRSKLKEICAIDGVDSDYPLEVQVTTGDCFFVPIGTMITLIQACPEYMLLYVRDGALYVRLYGGDMEVGTTAVLSEAIDNL